MGRFARFVSGVLFVFVADMLEHIRVRKERLDEVDRYHLADSSRCRSPLATNFGEGGLHHRCVAVLDRPGLSETELIRRAAWKVSDGG